MNNKIAAFFAFVLACGGCSHSGDRKGLHFTFLPVAATGIDFENTITENDSVNLLVNEYTYMGGGVGVGDFNNDGLQDVFFAGSQVSSQLYLNKGNMQFENITQKAGVSTSGWCTGVSVVDINNDGWPDIYVCVSGTVPGSRRKNLLFINQHNLTFKEEAAEYGLADTSFSTQAVFFDYDKDGALDMYLANHDLKGGRPNDIRDKIMDGTSPSADRLYHNEGIPKGMDHPVFKDVSRQAGILEEGYSLGVVVSDLNGDGYPDIYVANDYLSNDVLWLNNGNGTFTNCISSALSHQSYSSMGTDAADYNNDGLPDIATLDMQPETNERKKMMYSGLSYNRYEQERSRGYDPEFMRNMLHLNNGVRRMNGRSEPFFSEIGQMAGMSQTDWSWSVLMADFDNDGWKDMHITNGMGRDMLNADFVEYKYGTLSRQQGRINAPNLRRTFADKLVGLGTPPLRNYLYRNKGDLTFEDVSQKAGIVENSVSSGAVYVDLDNDGDLDIITSNINGKAFIMRNDLNEPGEDKHLNNYLTLRLNGDPLNKDGIGAKVFAYSEGSMQMLEQYPVRGYLSCVDNRLHFGFGQKNADSLKIIWADGRMQLISHPSMNRILTVNYKEAGVEAHPAKAEKSDSSLFTDITVRSKVDYRHKESPFNDYAFQPLIPQKYSQEGPFISTGDLNKDGLEDFFIGGAYNQSGKLFFQQADGTFKGRDLVGGQKNEEDMQSLLFDADGDGDLDLLVVSGSSEFDINSPFYRPRLYLNDGKGNFTLDSMAIPAGVITPGECIAAGDPVGDGHDDIFIGGRAWVGRYPEAPRSYLLQNDHGRFKDVTETVCPALIRPGMVTAAVWADIDGDKKPELIIAGEWMGLRVFKNNNGKLDEITTQCGMGATNGFWRSLAATDIDGNGIMDIVAGNMGLNNPFHISAQQPAILYAKDFNGNGIMDPIFCYYIKDEQGDYRLSPGINRDQWALQMPSIKKKFETNESFARASLEEILTRDMLEGADTLECRETRSGYFKNDGKGKFTFHPFPMMAQIAPVNALLIGDFDHDGQKDILIAGNEYQYNVSVGRMDASYGLMLKGDGKGNFVAVGPEKSGLMIDGDIKDLKMISLKNGSKIVLVARNDDKMLILRANIAGAFQKILVR